jgi:hypothetical protein
MAKFKILKFPAKCPFLEKSSLTLVYNNCVILVYMDVGQTSSGTATIAFTFSTTTSTIRNWEIKVTQIPCSSNSR